MRAIMYVPTEDAIRFDPQTAHQPPEDEIQWILNECSKYLDDGMNVRRSDVLSAWRGWRPLASDPHAEPVRTPYIYPYIPAVFIYLLFPFSISGA